ncbi:MAG: metallophosphoesterase [Bacteroidales bacterium]
MTQVDPIFGDEESQTMILHSGDWNCKDTELSWQNEFFNQQHTDAVEIRSKFAIMGTYGNHEYPGDRFKKYYPYSYDELDPTEESFCHSFDYGPVHVTFIEVAGVNATIEEPQLSWIIDDLQSTNKPWKVVVFHVPGYSNIEGDYHGSNQDVQDVLQPLLEQYNVQLVLKWP